MTVTTVRLDEESRRQLNLLAAVESIKAGRRVSASSIVRLALAAFARQHAAGLSPAGATWDRTSA